MHSVKFLLLIFLISSLLDGLTDLLHHMIVKIQIMKHTQAHAKHLFCLQKMADICSAVTTAGRALTAFLNRILVQLVFGIKQIQLPMIGIDMSMTSVTAWIYTGKEM